MNGVLRSMLEGVIDYAGLFPPAKLPLGEAINEYLAIMGGPNRWLVDRFACPVGKLPDLAIELAEHPEEPFIPVSVIGTIQPDHKHWKHGLEHDAAVMTKFVKDAENHAEIQAYEVRLPDHGHATEYVDDLRSFANIDLFAELPWAPEMSTSLATLAEGEVAFAKARAGGLEASAFPSSAQLAEFIQQCAHLDLGFKLTAGLHHPLPARDEKLGVTMHGFLNVLVATALAGPEDLSTKELEEILNERSGEAFSFGRDTLTWRECKVGLEDVEYGRSLLVSFGSCSVQEPVDGLAEIGLMEMAGK